MVRGIQVGQSPEAAIADAAEVVKAPLKDHLVLVKQLTDVGVPLVDALSAIAVDIDMPEFDFAVAAVSAQAESGGNLSSALMNLVDSIRARHQLQMKVQALSAEGKVSAAMMVMMPILLFVWLSMSRPDYVAPFYEDPTGEMLMFLAFGLLGIGAYVLSKIARIKV
nr:type II secretion system F family protein [Rhodovibrio sodomensis]